MTEKSLEEIAKVGAVCVVIATIFVALVFTALQFGWVEKAASLGDVLTFGSILVAAGIAFRGWRRADRIAQEERERIAKADGVILYRKLSIAAIHGLGLLLRTAEYHRGNLLKLFPFTIGKSDTELLAFYEFFQSATEYASKDLLDTEQCYEDLRSLYKYQIDFGDQFLHAVEQIVALKITSATYIRCTPVDSVRLYRESPEMQKGNFFLLLKCAADVSLSLERCRRTLNDVEFRLPYPVEAFVNYSISFYEAFGVEVSFEDKVIGAEQYKDMLEASSMTFGAAFEETQTAVRTS